MLLVILCHRKDRLMVSTASEGHALLTRVLILCLTQAELPIPGALPGLLPDGAESTAGLVVLTHVS